MYRPPILHSRRDADILSGTMRSRHSTIVRMETHIEFPLAGWCEEIPAGVYYPSVDRATHRFILMKANPGNIPQKDSPPKKDAFFTALHALVKQTTGLHNEPVSSTTNQHVDYLKHGYFPMENYHAGLGRVEKSLDAFLEQADFYRAQRLGYKRSFLLFGQAGMGKSRYVNSAIRRMIIGQNAIVIRIESVRELDILLEKGLGMLGHIAPARLKVIVVEELATLAEQHRHTELLNLLDHFLLRENVLFLMTTNTPESIPSNIVDRPSRVDLLQEVNADGFSDAFIPAWYEHFMHEGMPETWKEHRFFALKLSPAYLKELFLGMKLNGWSLDESLRSIEMRRLKIASRFRVKNQTGFN